MFMPNPNLEAVGFILIGSDEGRLNVGLAPLLFEMGNGLFDESLSPPNLDSNDIGISLAHVGIVQDPRLESPPNKRNSREEAMSNICTVCGGKLVPDATGEKGDMRCSNPECPGKDAPTGLEMYNTRDLIDELRKRSTVFFLCMRPKVRRGYDWIRSHGGRLDRVIFLLEVTKQCLLSGDPGIRTDEGGGDDDLGEDYDDTDESVDLGPD